MKSRSRSGDDAKTQASAPEANSGDAAQAPEARKTLTVGKPKADAAAAPRREGVRARFAPGAAKTRATERTARPSGPAASTPASAAAKPKAAVARPAAVSRPARPAAIARPAPVARSAAPASSSAAAKPGTTSTQEGVRLSKVMADRGLCSRREADEMIERGWVFVDGQCISELGSRIDPNAEITLAAQARKRQSSRVTILLHKPVGYVSGQPEPGYEPAVSLIGAGNQFDRDEAQPFDFSHLVGLAPAGRLDIDSTGLLVLTQDGRVARQLIGDDSKVDKEYLVRVEGKLDDRGLELLNHGLELDGRKLRPAKVEWLNRDQLRFVLREGRKRQIRRMCELVGLKVVGLKRIRIGRVRLGDLPLGQWRFLREDECF
ncbi:pseudouridine synthase [Azoarcus sp. KH32C]|uniref:pseudouridine synthase n=1 Tax=Azoarcus sp. KH32C TaxID=748247 RepID=UPI00023860F5|nr:pseudouridine synthase [Azoarcus sp. KH32C]BAL22985.1 ribosomal large subunit pseudouridine synthase F [Azoarcus sp. KH32C]